MESLFGIPMDQIMVAMLVLLVLCLAVVAWIAWRRRVIFNLGVRNIPRRKAQSTLIVIGLMLSTLIIAAALGTGDTLNRSVSTAVYDLLGPVDELVVASPDGDGEGSVQTALTQTIPESAIDDVRAMASDSGEIDAIGGLLIAMAPAVNIADNELTSMTSLDELTDVAVQSEPLVLLAGIDPQSYDDLGGTNDLDGDRVDFASFGPNEILLSETGADKLLASEGDTLVISVRNQPVEMTVAAIASDSVITGSLDTGGTPAFAMHLDALQELTGQEGRLSAIGISNTGGARDGLDRTDAVVDLLQPQLAHQGLGINTIKADNVEQAELLANVFVTVFVVFGLFSIAVGILLIVLIFTMLAAERRSEMGMERAVGAQRRLLIQQFIAEGAGYALLAGLVGAVLGAAASIGIAAGMQAALNDFLEITPYVAPQSIVIAYALGVVITFLAVSVASWRVSRLNVVAAVRDIPDNYVPLRNRKQLIWGIVMVVIGALMILGSQDNRSLFLFTAGMTLVPFGIAAIVTYFGWKPRWVLTVVGLYTLAFWLLPEDAFGGIFGEYTGDIEMFFLSGICIVAASTLVIMQNFQSIVSVVSRFGGRAAGWLPSIRLATSYPSANKGRTGMTIAMFSLIVFSLVVVASINENFAAAFLSDEASAGWDVEVDTTETNPIDDLIAQLDEAGYDTSTIEATGIISEPAAASSTQVRNDAEEDWENLFFNVMHEGYLENADVRFSGRASGYESDTAILDALRTEPDVMVIDSFQIAGTSNFGGPPGFRMEGVEASGTFDAPTAEIRREDGSTTEVRVIGVISSSVASLFGGFTGPETAAEVFPGYGNENATWYLRLAEGADIGAEAAEIERLLLPFGVQASDIRTELEDSQTQQRSFLYVMQGFMGLGLIVGIAAVGVIAFRAVVERRQEIGMLRALGFQRAVVARAFVMESALIVILGVVAGGITGLILSWSLVTSDQFSAAGTSTFIVPWPLIVITLVAAVVAALLMAWIPARQASRVLPAEALRYE